MVKLFGIKFGDVSSRFGGPNPVNAAVADRPPLQLGEYGQSDGNGGTLGGHHILQDADYKDQPGARSHGTVISNQEMRGRGNPHKEGSSWQGAMNRAFHREGITPTETGRDAKAYATLRAMQVEPGEAKIAVDAARANARAHGYTENNLPNGPRNRNR